MFWLILQGVRGDDAAKYERLDHDEDEVGERHRLENFRGEVAPRELHVDGVARDENCDLGHQESGADGARTEDDGHDEGRDGAADEARHHQVAYGVHAHGRKRVDFGVDDHSADVGGKR